MPELPEVQALVDFLASRTADLAVTGVELGSISVQSGEEVAEGTRVGEVGESADQVTREPHVHLGVRRTAEENGYLDPLGFLPERPRVAAPAPAPAPCRAPREPAHVRAPRPRCWSAPALAPVPRIRPRQGRVRWGGS